MTLLGSIPFSIQGVCLAARGFDKLYVAAGGSIAYEHVKAHAGGFWNEVADTAAKAPATALVSTSMPLFVLPFVFRHADIFEQWTDIGIASASTRGRLGLPVVEGTLIV